MAVSEDYLTFITDQLDQLKGFESKRMFGGIGFFKDGLMFGMIGDNTFRLKVDDHNKADFEAKGMKPFYSDKKKKGMPYWEVPAEIIDDKEALAKWAQQAFEAAQRSKKK